MTSLPLRPDKTLKEGHEQARQSSVDCVGVQALELNGHPRGVARTAMEAISGGRQVEESKSHPSFEQRFENIQQCDGPIAILK